MTIDWWTLGLQAVNVIILVWLLARFFWRPAAAIIERRRVTVLQSLAEAETKRNQATAALAEIERIRSGFDREREAIIAAAHQSAEQARKAILASAANEVAALEATARAAMKKEWDAAEQVWAERASRLAVEIAKRLVTRLGGPIVNAAFLELLLEEIRRLPDQFRKSMEGDGLALQAVSAAPIQPADQERYRQLIGAALGTRPDITFREDPSLIAGLELYGAHLVVNNSWRADLTKILADIAHDNQS